MNHMSLQRSSQSSSAIRQFRTSIYLGSSFSVHRCRGEMALLPLIAFVSIISSSVGASLQTFESSPRILMYSYSPEQQSLILDKTGQMQFFQESGTAPEFLASTFCSPKTRQTIPAIASPSARHLDGKPTWWVAVLYCSPEPNLTNCNAPPSTPGTIESATSSNLTEPLPIEESTESTPTIEELVVPTIEPDLEPTVNSPFTFTITGGSSVPESSLPISNLTFPDQPVEPANVVPPIQCPPQIDTNNVLYQVPDDCNRYYTCVHGRIYIFKCPDGLVFDEIFAVCNWPQDVQCL